MSGRHKNLGVWTFSAFKFRQDGSCRLWSWSSEKQTGSPHCVPLSWHLVKKMKNLGVILDHDLLFKSHINQFSRAFLFHRHKTVKIRNILSCRKTSQHICYFNLDYCRKMYLNTQMEIKNRDHAVLHWLPAESIICLVTYKSLNNQESSCVSGLIGPCVPITELLALSLQVHYWFLEFL